MAAINPQSPPTVIRPKNPRVYHKRMSRSIEDKLWFLKTHYEFDVLLDYGCGDGMLLAQVVKREPELFTYGYDYDNRVIVLARVREGCEAVTFASDYQMLLDEIWKLQEKGLIVAINLCSTLHEVLSYYTPSQIDRFWQDIFGVNADYVFIRDMGFSKKQDGGVPIGKIRNLTKVLAAFKKDKKFDSRLLDEHQEIWNDTIVKNYKCFIELMLKYRYLENWDKEVRETYLVDIKDLELTACCDFGYDMLAFEHYSLPYIRETVSKDFDFDFDEPTHFKMVLRRPDFKP